MKKVGILALEDCTPIASIGAMELLRKAGIIHQQMAGLAQPFFEVELLSATTDKEVLATDAYPLHCHKSLKEAKDLDLLLIPAMEFDVTEKLQKNKLLLGPIRQLRAQGTEIGSMCTGAFLLAETGLLNGKSATTHWFMADAFRQSYPEVQLLDERIIVDEGGLYTCGGATSFMNLILYLVEKYCGKQTAIASAKMLMLDYDRQSQQAYAIFRPQHQHADEAVAQAQQQIEHGVGQKLKVEELATQVGLSQRSFIRRFKQATGSTPMTYIQRSKIEAAKRSLEEGQRGIKEIIYGLGYEDLGSFRKQFKKYTGLSPSAYRQKYQTSPLL